MRGMAQLRSACLYSTTRSLRPLLRATMMYCADSVSSIAVRTSRTLVADRMIAMVSAGITRLSGPAQPDRGLDAQRHRDQHREQQRERGQRERGGQGVADQARHRRAAHEAAAEI